MFMQNNNKMCVCVCSMCTVCLYLFKRNWFHNIFIVKMEIFLLSKWSVFSDELFEISQNTVVFRRNEIIIFFSSHFKAATLNVSTRCTFCTISFSVFSSCYYFKSPMLTFAHFINFSFHPFQQLFTECCRQRK